MKPRRTTDAREQWRREQDRCFVPGCPCSVRRGDIMEVHEIIGGSDRPKAIGMLPTLLFLCREHHDTLGSRPSQESLVKQLAWKRFADPEHYVAATVVKLWRPNCQPALIADIVTAVKAEYAQIVKEHV